MKKSVFSLLLCVCMLFCGNAFATEDITINVNGKLLTPSIAPRIVNGRTMLPLRSVFEALKAKVSWFGEDKIIFATKGNTFITLKIGEAVLSVQTTDNNQTVSVPLDVAPYIENDYTLIPVRAVAESLCATVEWIDETRTVIITAE